MVAHLVLSWCPGSTDFGASAALTVLALSARDPTTTIANSAICPPIHLSIQKGLADRHQLTAILEAVWKRAATCQLSLIRSCNRGWEVSARCKQGQRTLDDQLTFLRSLMPRPPNSIEWQTWYNMTEQLPQLASCQPVQRKPLCLLSMVSRSHLGISIASMVLMRTAEITAQISWSWWACQPASQLVIYLVEDDLQVVQLSFQTDNSTPK